MLMRCPWRPCRCACVSQTVHRHGPPTASGQWMYKSPEVQPPCFECPRSAVFFEVRFYRPPSSGPIEWPLAFSLKCFATGLPKIFATRNVGDVQDTHLKHVDCAEVVARSTKTFHGFQCNYHYFSDDYY